MLEIFTDKLLRLAQRADFIAVTYPIPTAIYFTAKFGFAVLCCYFIYDKHSRRAFWCVIGLILVDLAYSNGDDTTHHVYRILVLSEQIKQGQLSLLFTNPTTGDAYPIFVYYSLLPYILPVLLTLAGFSAVFAFEIAMGLQLILFALGIQSLIERPRVREDAQKVRSDFFLAILFMSATYVYSLWLVRAAFAEVWAVSLAPWVVRFALSPKAIRPLTAVLFLQICAHPLLFLQCIVGKSVVALGLSRQSPVIMIGRGIAALLIAAALAMPFWLPQSSWLHEILGTDVVLPGGVSFSTSFLSAQQLFDPTFGYNIGIFLPCAVAVMIIASHLRLEWRVWAMIFAFAALAALQTVYLRDIASHIPIISQSQFIWRLMLPTALIAFGALLVGWNPADGRVYRSLASLALLSVGWMAAVQIVQAPGNIISKSSRSYDTSGYSDDGGHVQYLSENNLWGIGPFLPNYSNLRQNCGVVESKDFKSATFDDLRRGVRADHRFIYVHSGPIGFVKYYGSDGDIQESACRDGLVLGPLEPDENVWVSEGGLHALLIARALALIVGLLVILAPILFFQLRFRPDPRSVSSDLGADKAEERFDVVKCRPDA